VAGLAKTIPGDGCHVFEQNRVVDWDPRQSSPIAKAALTATHLPLGQFAGFYAEVHPRAEPMVVAPIGRVPDGMYIGGLYQR
jgi:hypothetical protein